MEIMQALLNSKKVKYVVMEELVKQLPFETEELNIFISADSIFKSFYSPKLNDSVKVLNTSSHYMISSEFINIMAHYRHFFYSRYSIPTNFYIYYSSQKATYNISKNGTYKESLYDKKSFSNLEFISLNKMIKENMELAVLLSEYLPNIFIIDTKDLDPSVVPYYIIERNGEIEGLTNLILTTNKMEYQLANLPNTFIMELKSDETRILNKEDIMKEFIKSSKSKSTIELDTNFYTSILSIAGCKSVSIKGIEGMGGIKTIKRLERLVKSNILPDDKNGSKLNITAKNIFENDNDSNTAIRNYNALSIEEMYKNMTLKQRHIIDKCLVNKSDNMSLMEINDKYYQEFPLMLIELMEGE